MEFQGEQLIWGNIGHFFVILSFVASLIGSIAFLLSSQSKLITNEINWHKIAKYSFVLHSLAVFGILLFYSTSFSTTNMNTIMFGNTPIMSYHSSIY